MMRQIAGAFAQYEKARLVARLRRAREVKGKLGGRKALAETRPEVVELACKLRKPTRSGRQRSLREISAESRGARLRGREDWAAIRGRTSLEDVGRSTGRRFSILIRRSNAGDGAMASANPRGDVPQIGPKPGFDG
jgi:hypothetical protein